MKKHLPMIIVSLVTFIILAAIFFLEYTFSDSEKIIFTIVFSVVIGYLFHLKRNAEAQIRKLLKAAKISKVGFWVLDLTHDTLFWSDEIYGLFGLNKEEFNPSYETFLSVIHPDDRDLVNEAYLKSLETKEDYEIQHRLLMNDGSVKWVTEKCQTEFDKNGNPLTSLGIVTNITKEIEYLHKIEELSYIDELTQLPNRKSYNEHIEKLLSYKKRYQTTFSIIMYDIDDFKYVNDTYGHQVGDEVLTKMSKLIKSHLRESDYIFRIGGEEFIILLAETNLENSNIVASKICKSVEDNLKNITDKSITISIGLTEVNDSDSKNTIFKRVDALLYKSKQNGKNQVSY